MLLYKCVPPNMRRCNEQWPSSVALAFLYINLRGYYPKHDTPMYQHPPPAKDCFLPYPRPIQNLLLLSRESGNEPREP